MLAYHYAVAEIWEKAQDYLFKAGDQAGRVAADAEALAHYRRAVDAYGRAFGDRWDPLQRAVLERKIGEALFRRGEHQQALEYLDRALGYLGTKYPRSRSALRLAILQQGVNVLPMFPVYGVTYPPGCSGSTACRMRRPPTRPG